MAHELVPIPLSLVDVVDVGPSCGLRIALALLPRLQCPLPSGGMTSNGLVRACRERVPSLPRVEMLRVDGDGLMLGDAW